MASTFFGLNIAYTGLMAANAKITTTANNISNVETKGYSRQEANQIAADALRISTSYGMAGAGVEVTDIKQIRNFFYDVKYWQSQTNLGQHEIKNQYMTQIEDYFAVVTDDQIEGFEPIFSSVFDKLTTVYRNSGDDSKVTEFIGSAGDLCKYFNSQATNLERLQLDVNSEIRNRVETINSIAEQIATLNKQINTVEVTGSYANELRDRRALLVDQLSKIVDVEVKESPIYIFEGSDIKSGINKYEVMIAGGQNLVNGYDYNTLLCKARDYKVNQSDAEGLYDLSWSNGLDFNLYGGNLGGELKGLIELRDGNNGEYFHGTTTASSATITKWDNTVTGYDPAVDDDPYGRKQYKVTVKLPTPQPDYLTDMNKNKLPQDGKLNFGSSIYDYSAWEYDVEKGTYTFTIQVEDDVRKPDSYTGNVDVSVGRPIEYQGIAYYQSQLNEWTRIFARAMNDIETQAVDKYGNPAEVLFTNKNIKDNSKPYTFADVYNPDRVAARTPNVYKSSEDDYYNLISATFQVNRSMELDVGKFGTTYDIHQGADAQDLLEDMISIKHDKSKASFRGCSAQEFLQVITSDIALAKNNAMTFEENYTNISKSVANQRMSVSSVDNDEEALNLVKFKEAYNLSAKVMQIMTEIYDRLILETGV